MKKPDFLDSPRGLLGLISDLAAVLTIGILLFQLITKKDPAESLMAAVLALIAVSFLAISFRLQRKLAVVTNQYARHVRTVEAMGEFSAAMSHMARAVVSLQTSTSAFLPSTDSACRELKTFFSTSTGHVCRITVKEVFQAAGAASQAASLGLAVRTLCSSETERDRTRTTTDLVDENTDFYELSKPPSPRFYLCNDLPAEVGRGYRNSHWSTEEIRVWTDSGDFPYKSAMVWPIKGADASNSDAPDIIAGFLCVDSTEVGTFDRVFDAPAGETFAHALYLGMTAYRARTLSAAASRSGDGEQN